MSPSVALRSPTGGGVVSIRLEEDDEVARVELELLVDDLLERGYVLIELET